MRKRRRGSQSPWQRHGKTAHRYSDAYQNWRRAALGGSSTERDSWAARHYRQFMGAVVAQTEAPPVVQRRLLPGQGEQPW